MFYRWEMAPEPLFEIARRRFDTPEFRGMEFIESECKTIINHVPGNYLPFNWSINPYRGCSHACSYCFARPTHTFLDMNAGSDFEKKIVVKVNAPEVLRRQLAAKRWKGEGIAMGTNTDPYQRAEGRYRLMPRDHPSAHRLPEPVLDPDQGHADPARPRAAGRGRRGDGRIDGVLDRDAGRGRLAQRASPAPRIPVRASMPFGR